MSRMSTKATCKSALCRVEGGVANLRMPVVSWFRIKCGFVRVSQLKTVCRVMAESVDTNVPTLNSADGGPLSSGEGKRKAICESKRRGGLKKRKLNPREEFCRPGFGDDRFDETEYYFENGLRKVRPYTFTFTTYCKGRWSNKKLIDVFDEEFRAQPLEEFEKGMISGRISVNGEPVPIDYVLKQSDFIMNKAHRHEVPVTDQPIKIIFQSDDFVVVDKPPSIPVHPCGRYRHNSLIFILGKEYGFRELRNAYRIDRLASGLLIFTRSVEKDREIKMQISSRNVDKEYLCRVEGEFPNEPVVCDEPIKVVSYKIGVCRVNADGKPCKTEFKKLSYNGKSSVVLCKPSTGRMHQIRVHLQYLGFPIINDPLYNDYTFGPQKGKNGEIGKTENELIEDLIKKHKAEVWQVKSTDAPKESDKLLLSSTDDVIKSEDKAQNYEPFCPECKGEVTFRDPKPEELIMYLHAWKYKGEGWNFETEIPDWAKEDWDKD